MEKTNPRAKSGGNLGTSVRGGQDGGLRPVTHKGGVVCARETTDLNRGIVWPTEGNGIRVRKIRIGERIKRHQGTLKKDL